MKIVSVSTALILFLFIACSDSASLKNSSITGVEAAPASNDIALVNNSGSFYGYPMPDFVYSDTIYGKDYRVKSFPDTLVMGYARFASLIYVDGQPDTARYMLPPACGDYVFIHEDGNVALIRNRAGCQ